VNSGDHPLASMDRAGSDATRAVVDLLATLIDDSTAEALVVNGERRDLSVSYTWGHHGTLRLTLWDETDPDTAPADLGDFTLTITEGIAR